MSEIAFFICEFIALLPCLDTEICSYSKKSFYYEHYASIGTYEEVAP